MWHDDQKWDLNKMIGRVTSCGGQDMYAYGCEERSRDQFEIPFCHQAASCLFVVIPGRFFSLTKEHWPEDVTFTTPLTSPNPSIYSCNGIHAKMRFLAQTKGRREKERERRKGKVNWRWSFGRNGKNRKGPSRESNPEPQQTRLILYYWATETSDIRDQPVCLKFYPLCLHFTT